MTPPIPHIADGRGDPIPDTAPIAVRAENGGIHTVAG